MSDDEDTTHAKLVKAWDDITKVPEAGEKSYEHYGMWVVEIDGEEWAVGTDDEADAACAEYIRETLWAFRAVFLEDYVPEGVGLYALHALQEKCEDANPAMLKLVGDNLDQLIEDAIAADGRGHFLSGYDGEEVELKGSEGETLYAYRIN